jgi:hypothetical protein
MFRLYIQLIHLIAIMFFVFSLVARTLGATQQTDPALRGFSEGCENQPQPCWNGIILGKTSAEATSNRISQLGYEIDDVIFSNTRQLQAYVPEQGDCGRIVANIDQRDGILYEFYVHPCAMQIGTFLNTFGTPTVSDIDYEACSIRLLFMDNHLQVAVANSVQPTQAVSDFSPLSDETVQLNLMRDPERLRWQGTLAMQRYKNQFPSQLQCP